MSAMSNKVSNINRSVVKFIGRIRGFTETGSEILDMSAWLQYWAFDCIGEINFSQSIGFSDAGKDLDDICQIDHEMMTYFAVVCTPTMTL